MSFQAPLVLLGLLAVPVTALLYARAQRRRAPAGREPFTTNPALVRAAQPRRPGWGRHLAPLLYGLAAAALIVALARPQATVAVPVEEATVVLATDHSRSMDATDIPPTRLAAAKSAAGTFLERVPDTLRVGAVAFNQRARLLSTPTSDRAAVRGAIDGLTAEGGTATGEGLALALAAARQPARPGAEPPPAAIVLLADGRTTAGRDPLEVAREAKDAGVPVSTVALGTAGGTTGGGLRATGDEEQLRRIAEVSGGRSYAARDAEELDAVYARLGSQVSTREERREVSAAAAGGGLLLLLAGGACSLALFGRLP